ncbi:hypothetical protein LJC15_01400 [Desulfovibrio sp. OttesenSCG-928-G11]|nr:hypothetical protein [Desulfovibrio sp. OttesenSCG-928-G11]
MSSPNVKAIAPEFDRNVRKLGIVARDYNVRFPNGYRDFSYVLPEVLALLDERGCDTVLFSLFSIIPRKDYAILPTLPEFANLRMICLEEFRDCRTGRKAGNYVVYHHSAGGWQECRLKQRFGRVNSAEARWQAERFAASELPRRIFGNACLLLCGESNGVRYAKAGDRQIHDSYGIRAAIPASVNIILNPVHDRMTRFEMIRKRTFLSQGGRWVVSVWNRGKRDRNGRTKDGAGPPWTVFYDGQPIPAHRQENSLGADIGILDPA